LLLSSVKYPWKLENKPPDATKIGLFSSDWQSYCDACEKLDWTPGKPFPFMLLMDTADEIAYSMSDLEDGLEKGIITMRDLQDEFGKERLPTTNIKEMIPFKTRVINEAVEEAAHSFCHQLGQILEGDKFFLINKTSDIHHFLKKVKNFARKKIYADRSAEQIELAGRSVIRGLLNHFGSLICSKPDQPFPENDFLSLINNNSDTIKQRELDFELRLFRRLPISYREKYNDGARGTESLRRSHLILDFISGMTDDFALETYQILEGIRIK
jgi:dGTPase